jgi:hypothetical protein
VVRSQLHELPENPNVRIQALKALNELEGLQNGKSIPQHLHVYGVTGLRNECTDCALSNYLCAVVPDAGCVWVSPLWIALYSHDRRRAEWRVPISLRNWPRVRKFVRNFDYGAYPFLVDIGLDPAYTG